MAAPTARAFSSPSRCAHLSRYAPTSSWKWLGTLESHLFQVERPTSTSIATYPSVKIRPLGSGGGAKGQARRGDE